MRKVFITSLAGHKAYSNSGRAVLSSLTVVRRILLFRSTRKRRLKTFSKKFVVRLRSGQLVDFCEAIHLLTRVQSGRRVTTFRVASLVMRIYRFCAQMAGAVRM